MLLPRLVRKSRFNIQWAFLASSIEIGIFTIYTQECGKICLMSVKYCNCCIVIEIHTALHDNPGVPSTWRSLTLLWWAHSSAILLLAYHSVRQYVNILSTTVPLNVMMMLIGRKVHVTAERAVSAGHFLKCNSVVISTRRRNHRSAQSGKAFLFI